MATTLYRGGPRGAIYVGDPETMEIPKGLIKIDWVHFARRCSVEEADVTFPNGSAYKFLTDEAREFWNIKQTQSAFNGTPSGSKQRILTDPNTVTCPACLEALGKDANVVYLELEEEEEEGTTTEVKE